MNDLNAGTRWLERCLVIPEAALASAETLPDWKGKDGSVYWTESSGGCPPVTLVPCSVILYGQNFRPFLPSDGKLG